MIKNKRIFGFIVVLLTLGIFAIGWTMVSYFYGDMIINDNIHDTTKDYDDITQNNGINEDNNLEIINIEGKNFEFTLKEIRVKKGDKVRIDFTSTQGFHDWVVDEFNAKTKQINTGNNSSVEFVADKTGTFEYYCSVGNHRVQGMVGKLIVEETPQTDNMMKNEDKEMDDNTMENENQVKDNYQGMILAGNQAPLIDFNKEDYEKALKSEKLVFLYFYANWCPTCKKEVAEGLNPAFNELSTDQVVGFRVNYKDDETDTYEKELAREFGVAYQHTKIFIKNGERLLKTPSTWNKDKYITEINKVI